MILKRKEDIKMKNPWLLLNVVPVPTWEKMQMIDDICNSVELWENLEMMSELSQINKQLKEAGF